MPPMNAATTIVRHLGGPTKASKAIGVHRTQVHKWMRTGHIPTKQLSRVVKLAADHGVELALSDLFPGDRADDA